jgi:hypothetical protein
MEISADAIYLGATIEARILVFEIGLRPGPGGAGAQVSLRVGRDCLKLNAVDWIIGGTGELARWYKCRKANAGFFTCPHCGGGDQPRLGDLRQMPQGGERVG